MTHLCSLLPGTEAYEVYHKLLNRTFTDRVEKAKEEDPEFYKWAQENTKPWFACVVSTDLLTRVQSSLWATYGAQFRVL